MDEEDQEKETYSTSRTALGAENCLMDGVNCPEGSKGLSIELRTIPKPGKKISLLEREKI